jgi:hypothetical protein
MGFIERELERISEAVRARQAQRSDTDEYRQLRAAQQALSWALEPVGFRAPFDTIMGIHPDSKDYPGDNRPPQS